MDVTIRSGDPATRTAGAVAALMTQGGTLPAMLARLDRAAGGAIGRLVRSGDFTGAPLELAMLHPGGSVRATRLLLGGLGGSAGVAPFLVLQATALIARRARTTRAGTLVIALTPELAGEPLVQAIAEGAVLGHYQFTAYRTESVVPPLRRIELIVGDAASAKRLRAVVERGVRRAEATCIARDLAWTPGNDLTPGRLAERAREILEPLGIAVRVLGVPQLERLGMGCLLAVGRGSPHPPCLVVLERAGSGAPVALVGKGITFDTGGISLKPREDMTRMKYDMSGAAAVIGAFAALGSIDPPFPVVGLLACAENMPDGRAFKPGDVLRAITGTTIEVTNTDAEGRLVLADALGYARALGATAIVDVATLTGAARVALGGHAAALFTADDALAAELAAASAATGERLWRLPLWDEYGQELRSDTADVVNSAGREGGASIAAAFLRRFAGDAGWAHLDIAPTGWSFADRPHQLRGPTGFGARLLVEWISVRSRAAAGGSRPVAAPAVRRAGGRARTAAAAPASRGRRASARRAARPSGG